MLPPLLIDGSILSGGGQIIRNAVALSALLSKPVTINNIRMSKKNSGLTHQIIAGVHVVKNLCNATVTGSQPRSSSLEFHPGTIKLPGRYFIDPVVPTSTSLALQAALPCLTFSQDTRPSKLYMVGKTSGFGSPQSDYTEQILLPFLQRRLGLNITLDVARRGYQANGGGIVIADVSPVRGPIPAVDLLERGAIVSIKGRAYASGFGEELADRIRTTATLSLVMADINPDIIDIKAAQEPFLTTVGRGSGLVLWAETKNGCVIGGSSVGLEHPNPKVIGRTAVTTLLKNLQHGGCVDEYLQDQMIVFLALAKGRSRIRTGPLTSYTKAAMWIAEQLTGARFDVTADSLSSQTVTISCEGIGYTA